MCAKMIFVANLQSSGFIAHALSTRIVLRIISKNFHFHQNCRRAKVLRSEEKLYENRCVFASKSNEMNWVKLDPVRLVFEWL